jgi:hypothetical protein
MYAPEWPDAARTKAELEGPRLERLRVDGFLLTFLVLERL